MRIIFYALDLLRMIAQDSLSGSSERLFQRGKGGARHIRIFAEKTRLEHLKITVS